ncbi:MAG: hypothetical protein PW734_09625 [Verrucomicrobium sp.]|nr:hypothetical protein [Verrucomicrobium sp.]
MDHGTPSPAPTGDRSNWNKPQPELIPPPTFSPIFMSAGIVFLVWGFTTHWLVSLTGLAFMIASICIWISEIRKDWRTH